MRLEVPQIEHILGGHIVRQILKIVGLVILLSLIFGCSSEGGPTVIEPEEPKSMCLVEVSLIDSNPPSWISMSDVYVSHTKLDTGQYYMGHIWWLRRMPDSYKVSFLIEEDKDIFVTARHYYGYTIFPLGKAGASLILASDWNIRNPSDTTNGLKIEAKTRFYSWFWKTVEFDALNRPVWREGNPIILRVKDVLNGAANINNFSQQRAAYFLESSYEVKTFRCVRSGTTRISSTAGVVFRRTDFEEPLGVLSPATKVPNVLIKTQMFGSMEEARQAFLQLREARP